MIFRDIKNSITLNLAFLKETLTFTKFRIFRFFCLIALLYSAFITAMDGLAPVDDYYRLARAYMGDPFPTVRLKQGEIHAELNQPYISPSINNFRIIIDNTGNITDLGPEVPKGILLMKDKILIKLNFQKKIFLDVNKLHSILGDKTIDEANLALWKKPIFLLLFPFFMSLFMTYILWGNLFLCLLISLITLFLTRRYKIDLGYKNIFVLSIYALAPTLLFSALLTFTGIGSGSVFISQFFVIGIFLTPSIKSFK
jgi:hypothetical protein